MAFSGISPVTKAALLDAREDAIKVLFADQKGIVLRRNLAVLLIEIQRHAVINLYHQHRPERRRRRQAKNFCHKAC